MAVHLKFLFTSSSAASVLLFHHPEAEMTWWLPDQWPVHCYLNTTSSNWLWHAFDSFSFLVERTCSAGLMVNWSYPLTAKWWRWSAANNVMPSLKHRSAGLMSVLLTATILQPPVAILNNKPPCQQQRFRRQDPWKVALLRPAAANTTCAQGASAIQPFLRPHLSPHPTTR